METSQISMNDIVAIIRRRRWSLILPTTAIAVVAIVVAFLWPPTFKSSSTILIEDQEIPRDYVLTTVTTFADQRLQTINQRIMSATRLLEIIRQNELYQENWEKWTSEELVQRMRKDIGFETRSSEVVDPRTGRPTEATIAFVLSYQGRNPAKVQKITTILTSLYLQENLRVREQQTQGAARFLEIELAQVREQLDALDSRITAFKKENQKYLPELAQFNLQNLDRVDRDVEALNSQLRTLLEQESYLQTQLESIPTDGESIALTRLNELKIQLGSLKNRVSDAYPDVVQIKAEIAELETQLARETEEELQPTNAAYINLASQLASTQSEIQSARQQIREMQKKREEYSRRIEQSPQVEEGYTALVAERANIQSKYDDLSRKVMEAKVAQGLEKEQMGERFTLVEPAMLPEKPVSPNRMAIAVLGIVLGGMVGVGWVALREFSDQSVHRADTLSRQFQLTVLAVVPRIITAADEVRARRKRLTLQLGVLFGLIGCVLVFHYAIMDLDVFWAKVSRKLDI